MAQKSILAAQVQTLVNNIKEKFFAKSDAHEVGALGDTQLVQITDLPPTVTESTVAGWGFTKNTGTYIKPTNGIPKSDLDSSVQTSLGKADTALQEHQSLDAYRTSANQDIIDAGKADKIPVVTQAASAYIQPNTVTKISGTIGSSATFRLTAGETGKAAVYNFFFTTGTSIPTINWPSGISWAGGASPSIQASKTYEVNISENYALVIEY